MHLMTVFNFCRFGKAIIFEKFTQRRYASNFLYDKDENGKIGKGLNLGRKDNGFSNYESIGLFNKPNFSDADFELKKDTSIRVHIIYM